MTIKETMNTSELMFRTSCQIAERTTESFIEHIVVGGERKRMEYSKPVIWLQETETKLEFMHGGVMLDELGSCSDFYGYMSSLTARADEIKSILKQFSITQESSLELVLRAKLLRIPVIETVNDAEYNRTKPMTYKSQFSHIPDTWRQEIPNPDYHAVSNPQRFVWPPLRAKVIDEAIVWSSKDSDEQNAARVALLMQKWKLPK